MTRFLFLSSCFSNSSTSFSFCLVLSHTSHGAPWQRVKSSSDWYWGLHVGLKSPVGRLCNRRGNDNPEKQVNGKLGSQLSLTRTATLSLFCNHVQLTVYNGPLFNSSRWEVDILVISSHTKELWVYWNYTGQNYTYTQYFCSWVVVFILVK